jgi:GNAT superfamily N-acetyltransferase
VDAASDRVGTDEPLGDGLQVAIREAVRSDGDFIRATWKRALREGPAFRRVRNAPYFAGIRDPLERVLGRAQTLVACDAEAPDVILGFLTYEPDTLHFAFVKGTFRRAGLAEQLLAAAKLDRRHLTFTAWTRDTDALLKSAPDAVYDPFKFLYP